MKFISPFRITLNGHIAKVRPSGIVCVNCDKFNGMVGVKNLTFFTEDGDELTFDEVQNGEGNKRNGITKEIIEETVKVMKILKEKKQVTEIGRSELTAIVTQVMRDKKKDEGFKAIFLECSVWY